jgi:hypothetical protein
MGEDRIDSWLKMCLKKKRMSEAIAHKIAARWGQRAYLCPHCLAWHCTKRRDKNTT